MSKSVCVVLFVSLALGVPVARAGDGAVPAAIAPGEHRFKAFCKTWLGKLRKRERANLANAKTHKASGQVVLSYIGYGARPTECKARSTRAAGARFIGKLKYDEYRYERRGRSRRAALASDPVVLSRTEVLEIFRHDGERWRY